MNVMDVHDDVVDVDVVDKGVEHDNVVTVLDESYDSVTVEAEHGNVVIAVAEHEDAVIVETEHHNVVARVARVARVAQPENYDDVLFNMFSSKQDCDEICYPRKH